MDSRLNKYNSNVGINLETNNQDRCVLFSPAMKAELLARWNSKSPHTAPAYDEKGTILSNVNALKADTTIYNSGIKTSFPKDGNGQLQMPNEPESPDVGYWGKIMDYAFFHFLFQENTLYGGKKVGEWAKEAVIEQLTYNDFIVGGSVIPYSKIGDDWPFIRIGAVYGMMQIIYSFTAELWNEAEQSDFWAKMSLGNGLMMRAYEEKYVEPWFPHRRGLSKNADYDPTDLDYIRLSLTTSKPYKDSPIFVPSHGVGTGFDNDSLWEWAMQGVIQDCIFGGDFYIKKFKAAVKDLLAFTFNADENWIYQYYRSEVAIPERGISYVHNMQCQISLLIWIIWINTGDDELLTYSTTYGDGQTNSTKPKTLESYYTHWLKWADGTYTRYVNGSPSDTNPYLINGIREDASNRINWMDVPAMSMIYEMSPKSLNDSLMPAMLRKLDNTEFLAWQSGTVNRESKSSFGYTINGIRPLFSFWNMGKAIFK